MANYTYVEDKVESKSEKHIRIFLIILFFVQVMFTTMPFIQAPAAEVANQLPKDITITDNLYVTITGFNMLVQTNGYTQQGSIMVAIIGAIIVIFPLVAFFFCILDKKSKKKWIASGLCSVLCAVAITFSMSQYRLGLGAVLTLIMNVLTLFMTAQGFQATLLRQKNS